jgi:chromate reductase
MPAPFDVAVLVGSLRKESFTRKTAKALMNLAPEQLKLRLVEIGDLPLYNPDLDGADAPAPWKHFRDAVRGADAVLFATPEYNRSVPGALKNAIDVGSRPPKESVFAKKPAAVVSASPGVISGFGANHHLRQSLVFLDMPTLQQPEVYLSQVDKLFDAEGQLINEGTKKFLQQFLARFAAWIERVGERR